MTDWSAYIREHLHSAPGELAGSSEVVGELAGHLEECYAALLARGVSEEEAFSRTCAQTGNWEELCRGIVSAKEEGMMHDRVRQIWVPSLVTLLSAWGILALLIWSGTRPVVSHPGDPRGLILYVPWLFLLPFVGAAGGYLSRRAQGGGRRAYVAGLFPALAMGAVLMLVSPFAFVINSQVVPAFKIASLAAMTLSWVILPGVALSAGVALQGLHKTPDTTDH
jgi:hypothetical protein